MLALTRKGCQSFWFVVVVMMVLVWREDRYSCEAAINSGVVPQAFFDFLEQQQRQRAETTGFKPPPPPPTTPRPPIEPPLPAYQPPPPEPQPPAELPPTTTAALHLPLAEPSVPAQEQFPSHPHLPAQPLPPPPPPETNPQPPRPPPPSPSVPQPPRSPPLPPPRENPSAQQLLQYREVILRQQKELELLKREIEQQKRLLQQAQAYKPPPPPPPPQLAPTFPAPNYQFKPPPPPPPKQPPPPPRPAVPTTRDGVIDFVPAEHKAVVPRPQGSPRRHHVMGSMPRDWIARQVMPSGHQHHHPLPSPHSPSPPQAWHRPNLASRASPVILRPPETANIPAEKPNLFSGMPLPRAVQSQAMSMGRKMCITQFYESHGCIDPVRYLPPGTKSQGLMMSCSSRASQHLCHAAGSRVPGVARGRSTNLALTMMMQSPSLKTLLEKCLTPNTVTKAVMKMMKGGGAGGMNPAAMMMMMGGEGGGGGMAALAMMNLMNKQNGGGSGSGDSLPAGAARPRAPAPQGRSGGGGRGGPECMSILPLIMAQGVEGGMLSPEMISTVSDMRKRMLPYTCQDVHYGVFFRMCCPGKVHSPSMMEMMTHCG